MSEYSYYQSPGMHIQYIEMSDLNQKMVLNRVSSDQSFKLSALNDTSHYYRIKETV